MNQIILHQNNRKSGSYYRKDCIGDVLYYSFIYRDIHITFAKKGRKNTIILDYTTERMEERGFIDKATHLSYKEKVSSLFSLESLPNFDEFSLEELYGFVAGIREEIIGKEKLSGFAIETALESTPLEFVNCPDQRKRIDASCKNSKTILIAINEPELFATMKDILASPALSHKKIVFITSENNEKCLPDTKVLQALLQKKELKCAQFENGKITYDLPLEMDETTLLIFGESGLLDARGLNVSCGVFCQPKGYHASAVAGQLGITRACAVYIPKGFSIIENVPVTKKTRLSYLILAKLASDFGEEVYSLPVETLYARYPHYFINVYENDYNSIAKEKSISVQISEEKSQISCEEFDQLREKAIKKHLESFSGCTFYNRTFSEQDGVNGNILVHGIRVQKSSNAAVIPCGKAMPLRKKMRSIGQSGTGIVSNFLFFLTPKLATLYNNLRFDRPEEMAEVDAGHLDYLLEYRDGKRIETFPLFCKTCIALKENGEFIFFNFRLGGGKISINGYDLNWNKEDVDPTEGKLPPVCIFTPYSSLPDGDADRETYRKAVGENRVNFVLMQERITAIRDGNVYLPGMGVVVSLERSLGETLCNKLNLAKNENGYYSFNDISIRVKLDAPKGISESDWSKVKWSYGGGLSLILNGKGLCDGDHMEEWFERDGWTSPLSRQTQESALHTLVKHPRTAIGTTKNGALVILVYSGRTEASCGADYAEMCTIARKLVPDIENLMNVDGGGSAMLGMSINGTFTELSLPSTSTGSTVGMVRPINTVLYVPLNESEDTND